MQVHSNLDIAKKSVRPFLFTISNVSYINCNMLSKSLKWELGFVQYIAKFTISRFVISRFECTNIPPTGRMKITVFRGNVVTTFFGSNLNFSNYTDGALFRAREWDTGQLFKKTFLGGLEKKAQKSAKLT